MSCRCKARRTTLRARALAARAEPCSGVWAFGAVRYLAELLVVDVRGRLPGRGPAKDRNELRRGGHGAQTWREPMPHIGTREGRRAPAGTGRGVREGDADAATRERPTGGRGRGAPRPWRVAWPVALRPLPRKWKCAGIRLVLRDRSQTHDLCRRPARTRTVESRVEPATTNDRATIGSCIPICNHIDLHINTLFIIFSTFSLIQIIYDPTEDKRERKSA